MSSIRSRHRAASAPSCTRTSRSTTSRRCRSAARRNSSIGCCSRSRRSMRRCTWDRKSPRLHKREDGRFDVETILGTRFDAGAVVIAGGVGSFQPRRSACRARKSSKAATSTIACAMPRSTTARNSPSSAAAIPRSTGSSTSPARPRPSRHVHRRAEFRGGAGLGGEDAGAGGGRTGALHRRSSLTA